MPRIYKLYLRDILLATERIEAFTAVNEETLIEDPLRFDGVLFNLMTIGEAVKNIPEELKSQYPEVSWREIARFRDHLVHHYFRINRDIVLAILKNDLPLLRTQVTAILQILNDDE